MITGTVHEILKRYLLDYMFGFDKKQFDMSLLKGEVNISQANFKPDKVNEVLEQRNLPFVIKAGMIRNLFCKINQLQLIKELLAKRWSETIFGQSRKKKKTKKKNEETPITLECDEILIILGPSLKFMTNHEYINDEDTIDDAEESREYIDSDSYDSMHYLRVVEARLKQRILQQHKQAKIDRK